MERNQTEIRLSRLDTNQRLAVIEAYANWVAELDRYGDRGQIYYTSHITLLFKNIPGDFSHKYRVMTDEVHRIYATLIRHVVHNARSATAQARLPLWIVVPDLPRRKSGKKQWPEIRLNKGLHLNGPMLMPTETRMLQTIWMHWHPEAKFYREYVRPDRPLARIHVKTVDFTPEQITDYALKTLKFKIPELDTIIVLPKLPCELPGDIVRHRSAQEAFL